MTTTDGEEREFRLPLDLPMSERRVLASKFGVNWDSIEIDLSEIPKPEDPDNPTDTEKVALARALTRIIGPNERFGLLYLAVKRQIPSATMAEIERNVDLGKWTLALGDASEDAAAPLAPPATGQTPNEIS